MDEKNKKLVPYAVSFALSLLSLLVIWHIPFVTLTNGYDVLTLWDGGAGIVFSLFQVFVFFTIFVMLIVSTIGILNTLGITNMFPNNKFSFEKINYYSILAFIGFTVLAFIMAVVYAVVNSNVFFTIYVEFGALFNLIITLCAGAGVILFNYNNNPKPEKKIKEPKIKQPKEEKQEKQEEDIEISPPKFYTEDN